MQAMNKQQFLKALRKRLSALPKAELEERLRFYNEIIEDRMEEGLSEAESVAAVGSAEEIAAQILGEDPRPAARPKKKAWEITLLILGFPLWFPLLVAAFAVALSLYVSLWAVIISLWAVFAALAVCALALLIGSIASAFCAMISLGIALVGGSLVCAGLSIFLFFGCKALTKGTCVLTKKLFQKRRGT
jgi:uncharacterized membrane protein